MWKLNNALTRHLLITLGNNLSSLGYSWFINYTSVTLVSILRSRSTTYHANMESQ